MVFRLNPLNSTAPQLNLNRFQCYGGYHYFREGPVPPGAVCACGAMLMRYDPCAHCATPQPTLVPIRILEEDQG